MWWLKFISFVIICLQSTLAQDSYSNNYLDTSQNILMYWRLRGALQQTSGLTSETPRLLEAARAANKIQEKIPDSTLFPCDVRNMRSLKQPTSVHELRPGDIDIIAALGDSLTSANGVAASAMIHLLVENRGLSWAGGGQSTWREFLTLPNIIKEFNPFLFGYAIGDGLSIQQKSVFNVAEPIAMSRDLPHMVTELVRRIKKNPVVDLPNDWKLVTLLMGGNDMCSEICYLESPETYPETHRVDLIKAFRYLKENLPRTLVNFVLLPHMETWIGPTVGPMCTIMRGIECSCMFSRNNHTELIRRSVKRWQQIERDVAELPEFADNDTFAIVIQPFAELSKYPIGPGTIADQSFLSADCFHLSQKMNARMSNALWNNMLQPVGSKSQVWNKTFETFLCPTEEYPYIYTIKNSRRD